MTEPRRPEALLRNPLAIAGITIATASAVVFVVLLIASVSGLFTNPYAGLAIFVAIPIVATFGAALIPLGMWRERRWLKQHPEAPADWPVWDFRDARTRRLAALIVVLAAVNGTIMLLAGYSSLHWMDSPGFCGQTCHTPMHPQFMAWQSGPHARIACANCHIGEGAAGFLHAKLNGVHQLVSVSTNTFARPIPAGAVPPTGGFNATCQTCHQPGRIPGDVVRVIRTYADDEKNTESMTVMLMHVGPASPGGRAIHWHADPGVKVEFTSTGAGRQTIPYVRVTSANGQVKEYFAEGADKQPVNQDQLRQMDCVDCHNMVGHRIWPTAEQAVDEGLASAAISRDLPFAHREAVRLLKVTYNGNDEALQAIDKGLRDFYASQAGVDQSKVSNAVAAVQGVYTHNIFPDMKVTWGAYPDNTGHTTSNGCFRCHDGSHTAKDGSMIPADCELCHKQVDTPVASALPRPRP